MINLLPTTAKRTLAKQAWLRLGAVLCLSVSFVCLLAAALAQPTGVVLARSGDSLASRGDLAAEVEKRKEEVEQDLAIMRLHIDHFSKNDDGKEYSTMIGALEGLTLSDVTLTHFNFDDDKEVVLTGTATTREALSEFRDRLSAYEAFKEVELPLSSLVKDLEVPFSITVTLK